MIHINNEHECLSRQIICCLNSSSEVRWLLFSNNKLSTLFAWINTVLKINFKICYFFTIFCVGHILLNVFICIIVYCSFTFSMRSYCITNKLKLKASESLRKSNQLALSALRHENALCNVALFLLLPFFYFTNAVLSPARKKCLG